MGKRRLEKGKFKIRKGIKARRRKRLDQTKEEKRLKYGKEKVKRREEDVRRRQEDVRRREEDVSRREGEGQKKRGGRLEEWRRM